jgi:hypothetical protein
MQEIDDDGDPATEVVVQLLQQANVADDALTLAREGNTAGLETLTRAALTDTVQFLRGKVDVLPALSVSVELLIEAADWNAVALQLQLQPDTASSTLPHTTRPRQATRR